MNRFIAIIANPGHLWTEHDVIDTVRGIRMCRCSDERSADEIAACLNLQSQHRKDEATKVLLDKNP